MEYQEREKVKNEAWELFSKASTDAHKANILLHGVITPHYWRARENLEARKNLKSLLKKIFPKKYFPGYEMDIDHYTEHWLFAQKNAPFMTEGIFEQLCKFYDPKESKYLPAGCTEYQI